MWDKDWWMQFWEWVVFSKEDSLLRSFFRGCFSLVALCCGGLVRLRNRAYDAGLLPVFKANAKVICLGNISLGGTGKTELTLWCAERLMQKGFNIAILTRGYGRSSRQQEVVYLPNGERPEVRRVGDEPIFLATRLKKVAVIVGTDRVASAALACKEFSAERLLLDDGFQHRRLARDLNLVCLDDRVLEAPEIFPRGALREGMDSIQRADFVIVKTERSSQEFQRHFQNIFQFALPSPFAFFHYELSHLRNLSNGKEFPPSWLEGKEILSFSAIAHPESFERMLARSGGKIRSGKKFADHHFYDETELASLLEESQAKGWILLTTEKDAVKLPENFPAFVASIRIRWREGEKELESLITKN